MLTDTEYSEFQQFLAANPEAGDVIQGTGGLRKVRWAAGGKGKSGGVRVIYYYVDQVEQLRMLLMYKKGIKDTLTAENLFTILLRSACGPRAVLAMLTYQTYAALAPLRHEPPAFARDRS